MNIKFKRPLSDIDLLVLGLVAEMPRHGYELERVIDARGMREWTEIGFSSIYFVLGKLEKASLVRAEAALGAKARKTYAITAAGRRVLVQQTMQALSQRRPTYSSLALGMVNWAVLTRAQSLTALEARLAGLQAEMARIEHVRLASQPLPDHVEAMFDFSGGQLQAEWEWTTSTLAYMQTKPWPE